MFLRITFGKLKASWMQSPPAECFIYCLVSSSSALERDSHSQRIEVNSVDKWIDDEQKGAAVFSRNRAINDGRVAPSIRTEGARHNYSRESSIIISECCASLHRPTHGQSMYRRKIRFRNTVRAPGNTNVERSF